MLHFTYAHQVVAPSNRYSATPERGVRKTCYKGTLDRNFEQMRKSSGHGENAMQICTLVF